MANLFLKLSRLFPIKGRKSFFVKTTIGFSPRSEGIYRLALLHKSAQERNPRGEIISNERLEFLGDAVLGTVIAMELYKLFPDKDEGSLTKMRSRIVNRGLLNEVGLKMGLDKLVKCQSQLELSQTHILGDAVEALIGAVFMDRGFADARTFVLDKILKPHFNLFEIALIDSNYKSLLIEWGHKHKRHVEFRTVELEAANDTAVTFECKVVVDGVEEGDGFGTSKKDAQQHAARNAYSKLMEPVG
ncbi:MAG: ribonuclease III [Breznakibacter sp.]